MTILLGITSHYCMPKEKFLCDSCGSIFERYLNQVRGKNRFCSFACRGKFQETSLIGESNPNYGNKWSDEMRKVGSQISKKRMEDSVIRKKCGANRGRKFSEETRERMSKGKLKWFQENEPHKMSEESKKLIGLKSKEKFTPEYLEKQKKIMVERGHWISDSDRSDYEVYFKLSDWVARMFDLAFPEDLARLAALGVWNVRSNKKGLVRDHSFSRRSGFDQKVFPEIMRHPCNVRLISHGENVSKAMSSSISDDSISLEELFGKIINYDGDWIEQEKCILLIEKYKCGERWVR